MLSGGYLAGDTKEKGGAPFGAPPSLQAYDLRRSVLTTTPVVLGRPGNQISKRLAVR